MGRSVAAMVYMVLSKYPKADCMESSLLSE